MSANQTRAIWLQAILSDDEQLTADCDVVGEALAESVTGLQLISYTDWKRLSLRTGLPRVKVFDALEDLTEAGYMRPWKRRGGYVLQLPDADEVSEGDE